MVLSGQFGEVPDEVPQSWVNQKAAEDFGDSLIRAAGFADWDHYRDAVRNERDMAFSDKYPGAVYDADRDKMVLHLHHSSGWKGIHTGLYTEMVPPGGEGAVDAINWNDYRLGGFGSDPSEQWPDESKIRERVNQWVEENGKNDWS